jgi:hypothetical protein
MNHWERAKAKKNIQGAFIYALQQSEKDSSILTILSQNTSLTALGMLEQLTMTLRKMSQSKHAKKKLAKKKKRL